MTHTRRQALGLGAAGAAALMLPRMGQAAGLTTLEPRPGMQQLLPAEYPETEIWGYGGRAPGAAIRVPQGGRVQRKLVNGLPAPTTVHWHGIRIDNAMDGVAGLTQEAVSPGEGFDYDFAVPDAGTYWYHAHAASVEQVARGLAGPLIVEETEAPDVDREETLLLDDWILDRDGQIFAEFDAPHAASHGGRIGNVTTTNGEHRLSVPVRSGERIRLRLINAANARIFGLALEGMRGWIVALDGMPLETPREAPVEMVLAPAQRIDLIVDVTAADDEEAFLLHVDNGEIYVQTSFPVAGTMTRASRGAPAPLPPNPAPALEDDARPLELLMEGGAMGGMSGAMMGGERMGMRAMMERGMFWAFNGVAGMPDEPLAELARGESVRLTIRNETAFPHAMHLHGMHFREIGPDGAVGDMRDTTLLFGGEAREIAFVADNPGDWLLHCHMLSHAASGMRTWLRVA